VTAGGPGGLAARPRPCQRGAAMPYLVMFLVLMLLTLLVSCVLAV
jgi:hypothetical protein